jgi:acyl carrier protein
MQERIGKLILDAINIEVPSTDTDLFETGVLDSLAFVELLVRLEGEFGISIALEDLEIDQFRSIGRIAEFVATRASPNGNPTGSGA